MRYLNQFHNIHYQNSREYYENESPIIYNGYLIFQQNSQEWHIVKNGVCLGMMAGLNGAKRRIDEQPETLKTIERRVKA